MLGGRVKLGGQACRARPDLYDQTMKAATSPGGLRNFHGDKKMKDSEYLKKLEDECANVEDRFIWFANHVLSEYLKKRAPLVGGRHVLDNSDDHVLGDDGTMLTWAIKNDGKSGEPGSEYEWHCNKIWLDPELAGCTVVFECDGLDFDIGDFEKSSIIGVVHRLERFFGDRESLA